jgi:predicted CXXCH cytochrome family protein
MARVTVREIITACMIFSFVLATGNSSFAFHSGGVGECEGCHAMHETSGFGGNYLLKSYDASSTCLNCHQHSADPGPTLYHISTPSAELGPGAPPKQLTPGGDFGWLKKNYAWAISDTAGGYSVGERHGHNIVAALYGYIADETNTTAPGGTYPSLNLGCQSCHNPHGTFRRNADGSVTTSGKPIGGTGSFSTSMTPTIAYSVGVYRLLAGRGYVPKDVNPIFSFYFDPPTAVSPLTSNRAENATQTRVAYGRGMSEWCKNCHQNYDAGGSSHPAANTILLGPLADNYNAYVSTGDLSGVASSSYLSLVPFEEGSGNYELLKSHARTDDTYLQGPAAGSNVMCLTCHRAHASGWDYAARWNTKTDFIVYNGYYSQEGQQYQLYGQGRTETEALTAYYLRPAAKFGIFQKTLCEKCHTQ